MRATADNRPSHGDQDEEGNDREKRKQEDDRGGRDGNVESAFQPTANRASGRCRRWQMERIGLTREKHALDTSDKMHRRLGENRSSATAG
jgi:hypothetical protein